MNIGRMPNCELGFHNEKLLSDQFNTLPIQTTLLIYWHLHGFILTIYIKQTIITDCPFCVNYERLHGHLPWTPNLNLNYKILQYWYTLRIWNIHFVTAWFSFNGNKILDKKENLVY